MESQLNGHSEEVTGKPAEAKIKSATDLISARLDQLCVLLNDRNNSPSSSSIEHTGNGRSESG